MKQKIALVFVSVMLLGSLAANFHQYGLSILAKQASDKAVSQNQKQIEQKIEDASRSVASRESDLRVQMSAILIKACYTASGGRNDKPCDVVAGMVRDVQAIGEATEMRIRLRDEAAHNSNR